MIYVNIVYDDVYDDVDIIAIPQEIFLNLKNIINNFLNWIPPKDDSDYWVILDGDLCMMIESEGFLKWLNTNYCPKDKQAYIVKKNTYYCPEYKSIEF